MSKIITEKSIKIRNDWIQQIHEFRGKFVDASEKLQEYLECEINEKGIDTLIDHLRLCGNIPESYGHDTSVEKLYSKYTDCLISISYKLLGYKSLVLKERADSADVEVFSDNYSFVADAKSHRLSRTAKNQKDFKVLAMNGWKRDKDYAMIVCPIYQLPKKSSQIYEQATSRNVCIFTYSHLTLLLKYSKIDGKKKAQNILENVFKTLELLNNSKSAIDYWTSINKSILSSSNKIEKLWAEEKEAASESISVAKEEALSFFAKERERLMKMSHEEALRELVKVSKIESKIRAIERVSDNGLFNLR